jgi:hypothetical protein
MPSTRPASVVVTLLAFSVISAPAHAQPLSADVLSKAKSNCLDSVAKTVNRARSSLKIIKSRSDASGASIDIKVPMAQAPWTCLTTAKGEVKETYFN